MRFPSTTSRAHTHTSRPQADARTSHPQPAAACGLNAGHSRPPRHVPAGAIRDLLVRLLNLLSTPSSPKQKRSHEGAYVARC